MQICRKTVHFHSTIYKNSTNYQSSYDTSLLSSGTNAGWASSKPFMAAGSTNSAVSFSYKENGFIMASGGNTYGQLGNTNTTHVGEPFALYKEGNQQTPFYNAIDWSLSIVSGVIDSTGKLYTSGYGNHGALGNGYMASSSSLTDQDGNLGTGGYLGSYGSSSNQHSFQQVLTAKDVADASKANALPDDYKAVSFIAGLSNSVMILDDGTLYGAGRQYNIGLSTSQTSQTHFTRLDGVATNLPQASASNKIKDISVGYGQGGGCVWVLYENGELYMTSDSAANSGQYHLVASDIKFFDMDHDSSGARVYAVNTSNRILSCTSSSSTLTTFVATPNGTVTQVRGSNNGGWGYLNSNNELYLSTTADGVVPGATNSTPTGTTFYKMDNVAFFDIGGYNTTMTYGVMYTNGSMTVWGSNTYGQLGNGTVGSAGNITTPDQGIKPDVSFDEVPDVAEDNGGFSAVPMYNIPPAIFLIKM